MWIANIFLYLMFLGNPAGYQSMVDAGATCYVWQGDTGPDSGPPACWY